MPPVPFQCPRCGAAFALPPDQLGRTLQCGGCGEPFEAPPAPPEPEPADRVFPVGAVAAAVTAGAAVLTAGGIAAAVVRMAAALR